MKWDWFSKLSQVLCWDVRWYECDWEISGFCPGIANPKHCWEQSTCRRASRNNLRHEQLVPVFFPSLVIISISTATDLSPRTPQVLCHNPRGPWRRTSSLLASCTSKGHPAATNSSITPGFSLTISGCGRAYAPGSSSSVPLLSSPPVWVPPPAWGPHRRDRPPSYPAVGSSFSFWASWNSVCLYAVCAKNRHLRRPRDV